MSEHDNVHNPYHYTRYTVDVIEITQDMDFLSGNVVKYVCRAPYKDSQLEDLKKAKWYLERLIERAEREDAEDAEAIKLLDEFIARRHEQAKERPTFNQVFFAGENCDCKVLCEDCDWEIENRERNY